MSTAAPQAARTGRVPLVEVVITEPLDGLAVPRLRALLRRNLRLARVAHVFHITTAQDPSTEPAGDHSAVPSHRTQP